MLQKYRDDRGAEAPNTDLLSYPTTQDVYDICS